MNNPVIPPKTFSMGRFIDPSPAPSKPSFDAKPQDHNMPIQVGQAFKSSGVDYSQYHPNKSWSSFRKNWSLVDDEKDATVNDTIDVQTGLSNQRKEIYAAFLQFFGDMIFVKNKMVLMNSIYVAAVHALTEDHRYIFLIVPNDNHQIGDKVPMSQLYWESLQSRTMREDYGVIPQNYPSKVSHILESPIIKTEDLPDGRSKYKVRRAILEVQMLKPPRNNQTYPDISTLTIAVQTFNTVVNFRYE